MRIPTFTLLLSVLFPLVVFILSLLFGKCFPAWWQQHLTVYTAVSRAMPSFLELEIYLIRPGLRMNRLSPPHRKKPCLSHLSSMQHLICITIPNLHKPLGKYYYHPLMGKLRLRKLKWVTKSIMLESDESRFWLRNLNTHQSYSCMSGSLLGPDNTEMKNTQSVPRESRCSSIQLWSNVITCAISHIKTGEIISLSSQDRGLLSHRNLGSNSISAIY